MVFVLRVSLGLCLFQLATDVAQLHEVTKAQKEEVNHRLKQLVKVFPHVY